MAKKIKKKIVKKEKQKVGKQGTAHLISKRAQEKAKNQVPITKAQLIQEDAWHSELSRGLYSDELLPKVEELASKGLTNKEIAQALSIGERTFYEWREKYPQFWHSIKKYRGIADIEVENALYKSAVGFEFEEVTQERRRIGKDSKGNWVYALVPSIVTNKVVPGNATAQIFYLKNRMSHRYKDKVETTLTLGNDIGALAFAIKRREE